LAQFSLPPLLKGGGPSADGGGIPPAFDVCYKIPQTPHNDALFYGKYTAGHKKTPIQKKMSQTVVKSFEM